MRTLSISELHDTLGYLDKILDISGEIIITKRGKTVARILPIYRKRQRPTHKDLEETPLLNVTEYRNIKKFSLDFFNKQKQMKNTSEVNNSMNKIFQNSSPDVVVTDTVTNASKLRSGLASKMD